MRLPTVGYAPTTPQIIWQNLASDDASEANIRNHIAKLAKFSTRLIDCRVVIAVPHRHHHQGNIYHVQIELTLPGGELVINRHPSEQQAHEDLSVAIRDAFESAERQLKDYTQQKRGEKKPRAGGDTDDERNQIPQSH